MANDAVTEFCSSKSLKEDAEINEFFEKIRVKTAEFAKGIEDRGSHIYKVCLTKSLYFVQSNISGLIGSLINAKRCTE